MLSDLLRSLIQNPTKAYELAKTITLQSMSLLICISTKNFVCVHSSFYQSIGVASKYSIYVILYVLNFRESFYARSPLASTVIYHIKSPLLIRSCRYYRGL